MSQYQKKSPPSALYLEKLLATAKPLAGQMGWTHIMLKQAALEAGLSCEQLALVTPNGVQDIIDLMFTQFEEDLASAMAERTLDTLKIREKVRLGVAIWFELMAENKPAVKRAIGQSCMTRLPSSGLKRIWRVSDIIWRSLGDPSTDWNWYSKRTILSGVLASTLLVWLEDKSDEKWPDFLDGRIDNVMQFETFKRNVQKPISTLSDIFSRI